MIIPAYLFLCFFSAMLAELFLSTCGVIIPVTALTLYYFTVTRGLFIGVFLGFFIGVAMDASFYRTVTFSPFIYITTAYIAHYWAKKGQPSSLLLQMFPGALIAAVSTIPFIVNNNIEFGLSLNSFFSSITHLLITLVLTCILLPVVIYVLDIISELIDQPVYREIVRKGFRGR